MLAAVLLVSLLALPFSEGHTSVRAPCLRLPSSAWVHPVKHIPARRLELPRNTKPAASLVMRGHEGAACGCSSCIKHTPSLKTLLSRRGGGGATSTTALTVLSRAVGYVIIAGSMLYKVPQVVRIFNKRSAEGISSSMFCLETVGTTMSLLFSVRNAFPFSTYGEAFFILAQNVAILVGISVFDKNPSPPMLALGLLAGAAACTLVLSPAFPMAYVSLLQTISIPLLNFSRIPQIVMNYQRKSTGELAPTTLVLQAAGNLARIFTTIVQVQNSLFLLSTLVAMAFNATLCYQYFLYRPKSNKAA